MEQSPENIFSEGQVLLINKPLGWTSFDAVRKIRNLVRVRKVGHAGTLDPLATGLLILCTGKFTKQINEYMAQEKEYTGSLTLGATTPTFDLESLPENEKDTSSITTVDLDAVIRTFTGEIWQVPPIHSAIKKEGTRVYKLARMGKEVKLDPRRVTIKEFEITDPASDAPGSSRLGSPIVHFRVVCTTGTYIRSLANDVGAALGCGAYLSSLCRTRIGGFTLDNAMDMQQAEAWIKEKIGSSNRV
ncbi:MAG TPA: tRNA pseudouridine(55) synthase TruB [Puia sp.]|nr:tRNA pseudouridine(55) synthase TruB [Puia sp.]